MWKWQKQGRTSKDGPRLHKSSNEWQWRSILFEIGAGSLRMKLIWIKVGVAITAKFPKQVGAQVGRCCYQVSCSLKAPPLPAKPQKTFSFSPGWAGRPRPQSWEPLQAASKFSQRLPESQGCEVGVKHFGLHSHLKIGPHSHSHLPSMSSHLLLAASLVVTITLFSTSTAFDLCPEPNIPNGGTVNSKKAENFFLGEVTLTQTRTLGCFAKSTSQQKIRGIPSRIPPRYI